MENLKSLVQTRQKCKNMLGRYESTEIYKYVRCCTERYFVYMSCVLLLLIIHHCHKCHPFSPWQILQFYLGMVDWPTLGCVGIILDWTTGQHRFWKLCLEWWLCLWPNNSVSTTNINLWYRWFNVPIQLG